jgi:hypothetical protein
LTDSTIAEVILASEARDGIKRIQVVVGFLRLMQLKDAAHLDGLLQ